MEVAKPKQAHLDHSELLKVTDVMRSSRLLPGDQWLYELTQPTGHLTEVESSLTVPTRSTMQFLWLDQVMNSGQ